MKLNVLVYAIIGVVVAGGAFFVARDMLSGPAVGDCVSLDTNSANLEFSELKCTARQAMFEVAAVGADCPPGDYLVTSDGGAKTCYVLDIGQGSCAEPRKYQGQSAPVDVRASSCTVAGAKKVSKVIDGKSDKSACENQDLSLAYSKPAKTICMVKP